MKPRKLIALLVVPAIVYIGICAVLFFAQRSFIYFPQPGSNTEPAALKLAADRRASHAHTQLLRGI